MNLPTRASRCVLVGALVAVATSVTLGCKSNAGDTPPSVFPTLTSVGVNPTTVVGGNAVQGTVALSAAPTSGATVVLSSNNAAATVPSTVTVNSGATTAGFTVTTTGVTSSTAATISGSFGGTAQSAVLTITPPPLTANFTVTSLSDAKRVTPVDPAPITVLPAGSADACPLVNSSNPVLDCSFNGATSTPPGIASYTWTYSFGTQTRTETTTGSTLKPTTPGCGFFGGVTVPTGQQFIGMKVDLVVKDAAGNSSAVRSNQNVRIFPAGLCGYGF